MPDPTPVNREHIDQLKRDREWAWQVGDDDSHDALTAAIANIPTTADGEPLRDMLPVWTLEDEDSPRKTLEVMVSTWNENIAVCFGVPDGEKWFCKHDEIWHNPAAAEAALAELNKEQK